MHKKIAIVSALLLLVGAGCTTAVEKTTSPIQIGWMGPLTGDAASLGEDALVAAQLAVEEVNTDGGVDGRPLELLVEDSKCSDKDAATIAQKLINVHKVPVIVGGLCSGETTAAAPIAETTKTVLFSGCSSAPHISEAGDFVFRSYPSDAFQGTFVADYIFNELNKKKVAVLAVQSPWGQGIKQMFSVAYKKLGGEIVVTEDVKADARDLRTPLTKIKASDAEMLYFLGVTEATLVGLKQIKEIDLDIPIIGGDTWDDSKIIESPFAEGVYYTLPNSTVNESWKTKLQEKGGDNTICAPGTYNNIKILADIMSRVGTDATDIKNELYKVKDFPGVNGPVTLDELGDVVSVDFEVRMVRDGESERIDQ